MGKGLASLVIVSGSYKHIGLIQSAYEQLEFEAYATPLRMC
jgi:hypothetical protein